MRDSEIIGTTVVHSSIECRTLFRAVQFVLPFDIVPLLGTVAQSEITFNLRKLWNISTTTSTSMVYLSICLKIELAHKLAIDVRELDSLQFRYTVCLVWKSFSESYAFTLQSVCFPTGSGKLGLENSNSAHMCISA